MNYLDKIIAIWSTRMRSTLELQKLNAIWGDYNSNQCYRGAVNAVIEHKWKYHKDKVSLFLMFVHMLK